MTVLFNTSSLPELSVLLLSSTVVLLRLLELTSLFVEAICARFP